ncbi:hypothetical protein [Massilia yuzhufengensis]|uniref:Uncharacterized protein n=1 Tax=Massilia yuzhufengensis TaxID=1164594 RepID=A0A1I1QWZ2_9BURK|nr:hypothetical protein [Massilia yuzhufengensis]SFD26606.1 hypothetical protein SAMN05216204_12069 [Massilia yuzhufengensis]
MQHTLVAVFDNRTDAQNAMNELLSSNFSRNEVKLSNADPTGMTDSTTGRTDRDTSESGEGLGASIKHFFNDLFGADNSVYASRYEGAVTRGHHVLTVIADSLPEVERAADIVERYGPTDIDEQASGPGAGAMGMGGVPESMRMGGAGGMQQTAHAAAQSATGANQQLDNPGDRKLFQQQSLNQAEPMGTTYQEPMGKSGLTATGGTSLQGSTLQENSVQGSSLDGTQNTDTSIRRVGQEGAALQGSSLAGSAYQGGAGGAQQRDSALGGSVSGVSTSGGFTSTEIQRGKSRIYSPSSSSGSSLDIGSLPGDDDEYYRNHFLANYSNDDYDSVKPAYAYGSSMARDAKYSGRKWDEVETDLRSDWETRNSGSTGATWDRMKAAVRRGWDRITSDDDDAYYRSHYDSRLGDSGDDYDSYKPAYSYGTEMRKSQMYRNQPWDDIEGDMRKGWDSRIAQRGTTGASTGAAVEGAWDRMKAAVRHGWERITDDDDNEYRSHWTNTYGVEGGGTYDEYRPAYTYGSEMARSEKYRGRQWNDVENDLRSDWDTRYGSTGASTWEKMKSAVRHGWDRMTS